MLYSALQNKINYLRISLTDKCNLNCFYCSKEFDEKITHKDLLRFEEIEKIVRIFSNLGVLKLRITGGEPFLRKGLFNLIRLVSRLIKDINITTNGTLIHNFLNEIKESPLNYFNVSLDTLDRAKYKKITGKDALSIVLKNLKTLKEMNKKVKINCVLMRNTNLNEIENLIAFAGKNEFTLRFIQFMPVEYYGWDIKEVVSEKEIINVLKKNHTVFEDDKKHLGPARYYVLNGARKIGVISSMCDNFCDACNRLRLTFDGHLKNCLFSEGGLNLKDLIRGGAQDGALKETIINYVKAKKTRELDKIPGSLKKIGG